MVSRNLHVIGTKVGSLYDTTKALELAARVSLFFVPLQLTSNPLKGQLKPICEVFPLAKMPDAVEKLRRGSVAGRLIVDFNS